MPDVALQDALERLLSAVTDTHERLAAGPVTRPATVDEVRELVGARFDLARATPAVETIAQVVELLDERTLHVTHPRYYGLFNPSVVPISVVADALVAAYNPQLAAWMHSPAAQEMERLALHELGGLIGWAEIGTAHFTSGGQEANATAVLAALERAFPDLPERGWRGIDAAPVFYLSDLGHDSLDKIAAIHGLGHAAVRRVAVGADGGMDVAALRARVAADRTSGHRPFLVVATGGTTSTGALDPIGAIAEVARSEDLWMHVDAAWGGGALLSERLRGALDGIDQADSVTWDAHKWLSVPVAAGMFFSRHRDAGLSFFEVAAKYVPPSPTGAADPYVSTMQWSRRCIGLKVLMALAERGRDGYAAMVEHQAAMGDLLRQQLQASGWRVRNRTPLPLICFTHPQFADGSASAEAVAEALNDSGRAWMSTVRMSDETVLRACICSYRTTAADIDETVGALNDALQQVRGAGSSTSAPAGQSTSGS